MDDSPILFIDADEDDHMLFEKALAELGISHPVRFFTDGQVALDYLSAMSELPFLIIAEFAIPGMNGMELRQQIEQDPQLRKKSIPFIFMTAPVNQQLVDQAYELTIQGIFEKSDDYATWKKRLQNIVEYWTDCLHPKRYTR